MYKRILVAVDGSAASDAALHEAIKLALSVSGALRLVHVVDELILDGLMERSVPYEHLIEALLPRGRAILMRTEALVRKDSVNVDSVLLETHGRHVGELVIAHAKLWPADLIVMGTHGRRGASQLTTGSDAEQVVRASPVPVLLVSAPAREAETSV